MNDGTARVDETLADDVEYQLQVERERLQRAMDEVSRVVVGQQDVVRQVFIALLCGGHVLVEGAPGLGKTLLVRTLSSVCGLDLSRVQFTPDLMPADITGSLTLVHDDQGRAYATFQKGPVFAQMVLADEVNRATPKTQAALLEAMQEGTVTVSGEGHELPRPFFVLATQNPIEMEGTYDLPEAQIDRFFLKVVIPYPGAAMLDSIIKLGTQATREEPRQVIDPQVVLGMQELVREVPMPEHVRQSVVQIVLATQQAAAGTTSEFDQKIRFGVSPRGGLALALAAKASAFAEGRNNASVEDIRAMVVPVLRHRIKLTYEAQMSGVDIGEVLEELIDRHLK